MPTPDDLTNPIHWLMAACMALIGISGWLGRRAIKRMDEDIAKTQEAIEEIKETRVTKKDFDELRGSITTSLRTAFEQLDKGVERRHAENREEIKTIRADIRELWSLKNGRSN